MLGAEPLLYQNPGTYYLPTMPWFAVLRAPGFLGLQLLSRALIVYSLGAEYGIDPRVRLDALMKRHRFTFCLMFLMW